MGDTSLHGLLSYTVVLVVRIRTVQGPRTGCPALPFPATRHRGEPEPADLHMLSEEDDLAVGRAESAIWHESAWRVCVSLWDLPLSG
jgi:hypothetical protein